MSEPAKNPLRLFYCYAHEDKALRDTLDKHLSNLKRRRLVEIWYDRETSPGMEWEHEIDEHLSSADIILLLVSADFLASDYCYGKEMARALQRHEEGTARVIPIILRPVHWEDAPFSKLQVLPTGTKPVTRWMNPDDAYEDIVRSLYGVVKELRTFPKTAEEWFREGDAFRSLGRYEEAIRAFDRAVRLNPNDASAYNNKGEALYELKHYNKAIRAFDEAIRLDLNYADAYNSKGFSLYKLGCYSEAIEVYEEAIQLNLNDANIYRNKGFSLYKLGRYSEAIEAYEEAIRLDPSNVSAYIEKGQTLVGLERYEEAIEAYEGAIRFSPGNSIPLNHA